MKGGIYASSLNLSLNQTDFLTPYRGAETRDLLVFFSILG